ncbi:hypothetical protein [Candidatus Coxiella mudrowiae]|uniref:hypothetical protein n=1 Tax=Candidatus Coxiella mudrowiae TaxID=2054173 RepID=UPI001FD2141B|nr:hypothetical protein [Candidatus Coxiella mudrowiae]
MMLHQLIMVSAFSEIIKNQLQKPHILLVEDNSLMQQIHLSFLKNLNCKVRLVKDAKIALAFYGNRSAHRLSH